MTFFLNDIEWVNDAKRGTGNAKVDGIKMGVQKNGKTAEGEIRYCNCLTLSEGVMEQCGLKKSDHLLVGKAKVDGKTYLVAKKEDSGHSISINKGANVKSGNVKFSYVVGSIDNLPFSEEFSVRKDAIVPGNYSFYAEIGATK